MFRNMYNIYSYTSVTTVKDTMNLKDQGTNKEMLEKEREEGK